MRRDFIEVKWRLQGEIMRRYNEEKLCAKIIGKDYKDRK